MKITKRQLRRIIREEKARLLKESSADMASVESAVNSAAANIAGMVAEGLAGLPDEEPDAFRTPEEAAAWPQQVDTFQTALEEMLVESINEAIEETEMSLHDGQFLR